MKKVILLSMLILALIVAAGYFITSQSKEPDYKFSGAAETAEKYFTSWGKKDWPNMYATVSDGFKKIEPTAKTLADFKKFAEAQNITGIKIISLKEKSNDRETAVVDYSVEFVLADTTKKPFSGSFTLKYREADVIKGWKLTHPYGENIDIS